MRNDSGADPDLGVLVGQVKADQTGERGSGKSGMIGGDALLVHGPNVTRLSSS